MKKFKELAKIDKDRRFSNMNFYSSQNVHHPLMTVEGYSKSSKKGDYQYVSSIMGIFYNPFLSAEAGCAYISFEDSNFFIFRKEKIKEIKVLEREKSKLG